MPRPIQFKQGEVGEDFIQEIFESSGIPLEKAQGKCLEWDFKCVIGDRNFFLEVKYDKMESTTGRVALEYHNNRKDKPSGILATASDIWAIVLDKPKRAFITSTERLKQFFQEEEPSRDIRGGENGAAMLRLYETNHILEIFHPVDSSPWETYTLIESLLEKDFAQCKLKLS